MGLLAYLFVAKGVWGLRQQKPDDNYADLDSTSQLWQGMDVFDRRTESDAMRSNVGALANRSTVLPKLQILGMFDSGTNLLGALLKKNLGADVLNQMCPGSDDEGYHCHFWKHTPPQDVPLHDLRLIAIVRSPLAHLSGWIKAAYDLSPCISGINWLSDQTRICSLKAPPGYGTVYIDRQFNGPTGVWNAYVDGYHNLAEKGATIKIVEYENVVLNTEKVVRDIGTFLGVPVGDFQQIVEPAKAHGAPVGRELAVQHIRDKTYKTWSPWSVAGNVKQVCQNLEGSAMQRHSFQLSSSEERLYKSDCDWPAFSFS